MKQLGLDFGTTTISAVVMEEGIVLKTITLPGAPFLPVVHDWEKLQDPAVHQSRAFEIVEMSLREFPDISQIGVTGQMHGILYLDCTGAPVSPLYTWQDGRGDLPMQDGSTYVSTITAQTGMRVATGYGLVTHYYQVQNGLVPQNATVLCTIQDYITMRLGGLRHPVIDRSNAASLGLFDVAVGCFCSQALEKLGLDENMLPEIVTNTHEPIGYYQGKIPVYVAVGDNQTSFLGTTDGLRDVMLVNFGTGSQFSVFSPQYLECPGLETRPFPGGGFLLVGASLCGGRAYALLETFFRETARTMTGAAPEQCYDAINRMLSNAAQPRDLPELVPLFQGTRTDPQRCAEIRGLTVHNFTPLHLVWAMLYGMTDELYNYCQIYLSHGGMKKPLYGSGNGLQKNKWLQVCVKDRFEQPLILSKYKEEAARGAALLVAESIRRK